MNLFEPERTPWDVNFHLLGIPVRIHPFFWLTTVILGFGIFRDTNRDGVESMAYLLLWVACVLVSIVIHEMGHVLMGKHFGSDGYIVLTGFFGLAIGSNDLRGRWQRVAVSFAGPLAQFILIGIILSGLAVINPAPIQRMWDSLLGWSYPYFFDRDWPLWVNFVIGQMIWINLAWALVNLFPIWPLDGGMISREVFRHFTPANGLRWSLMLSLGTAGLLSLNALISLFKDEPFIPVLGQGSLFTVIFFGIFAFGSWQLLQQTPRGGQGRYYRVEEESYERAPWERDPDWWKRG